MLESLCHEKQFREEDGVVHFQFILDVSFVELMLRNGQMVVDDLFHFGCVPLRLEPAHLFFDEDGVGSVAVLVHEDFQLLIAENDEVGVGFQHLCEEVEIVLEGPAHVGIG